MLMCVWIVPLIDWCILICIYFLKFMLYTSLLCFGKFRLPYLGLATEALCTSFCFRLHFWLGKTITNFFKCSWQGLNLGSFGSRVRRSTNWATQSPHVLCYCIRLGLLYVVCSSLPSELITNVEGWGFDSHLGRWIFSSKYVIPVNRQAVGVFFLDTPVLSPSLRCLQK